FAPPGCVLAIRSESLTEGAVCPLGLVPGVLVRLSALHLIPMSSRGPTPEHCFGADAMNIQLDEYFDRDTFSRIRARADQLETPFLVVDLKTIDRAYDDLVEGFPYGKVYYAVKANPANEVLELLKNKGSNFDIA